jgi:carboxyl-terminal processing protease
MVDDQLVRINGKEAAELKPAEMNVRMSGAEGSKVTLTLRRSGREDFTVTLVRTVIDAPAVLSVVIDESTGYILLKQFSSGSAKEFGKAAAELKQQGVTNLILDLRDNPGGLLDETLSLTGVFIGRGQVAAHLGDKSKNMKALRTTGEAAGLVLTTVVLVNENSASASELLAGALQDHQAALVLGAPTYGKGSMQELVLLSNGGGLYVTEAKFYTPQKKAVSGVGIKPDYQVLTAELQVLAARKLLHPPKENAVTFSLDEPLVTVDDMQVSVRAGVLQESNAYYLPVRILFEALGFKVDRRSAGNGIKITGFGYEGILSGETVTGRIVPGNAEEEEWYINVADLAQFGLSWEKGINTIKVQK